MRSRKIFEERAEHFCGSFVFPTVDILYKERMTHMIQKSLLVFTVLAMAAAAHAKTYTVTLFQPSQVANTVLAPGEYKVDVKDNKVTIRQGKTTVETQARVENTEEKFSATSVRYQNGDGKYRLHEIRLGGTNTKLVFN